MLVRQRPGKGNAIFITIEDETGVVNAVLWMRTFTRFRKEVMGARLIEMAGAIERGQGDVLHLMANQVADRSDLLSRLTDNEPPVANTVTSPARHPRQVRVLPPSRDFH